MDFIVKKSRSLVVVPLLLLALSFPPPVLAVDVVEGAGVGVGLTAGNLLFVPVKVISFFSGLIGGAASFVATGGSVEVTRQMWQSAVEGPYLITPSVARTAIGARPEQEKK